LSASLLKGERTLVDVVTRMTKPTKLSIERASSTELERARRLLSDADLPTKGLEETELWCAKDRVGRVIGVAGLEFWGRQGLLRSVAVEAQSRKEGVGTALVGRMLEEAKSRKLAEVYLLTKTAPRFFAKFGFRQVERRTVKGDVRSSIEFSEVCSDTAPMKLALN
jgi:amino-acid N-acetyltransferase